MGNSATYQHGIYVVKNIRVVNRDVEVVRYFLLLLPALLEGSCFRVCFLTFGKFCLSFQLRIKLVASEFASAQWR